jgi:predicted nucleotidyltransferase
MEDVRMVSAGWEDKFRRWAGRASDAEDEKRVRTENAIKEAIQESTELARRDVRVFAKGSYRNNTNVRLDSDVDVAVEFQEMFYWDAMHAVEGMSALELDIMPYSAAYPASRFKDDVERALTYQFGTSAIDRGNKAIHVREEERSLAADVVPCFAYRRYYALSYSYTPLYYQGIEIRPDSGGRVINWPEQNYENGVAKNVATGRRYKRVVRILKRLENEMVQQGIVAEVPSFLIECMIYNVPNKGFGHSSYHGDVRYVLAHLFNGTLDNGGYETWVEVNELKYLFHPTQRWTRNQAHTFLSDAWDYIGFD